MPSQMISPENTGVHGWPSQNCSTCALIGSFHISCVTIQWSPSCTPVPQVYEQWHPFAITGRQRVSVSAGA